MMLERGIGESGARTASGCTIGDMFVAFWDRLWIGFLAIWIPGLCFSSAGWAQTTPDGSSRKVQAEAEVEAIAGEPFGVARVRYAVEPGVIDAEREPIRVKGLDGNVLYPAQQFETEVARSGPPLAEIPPGRGIGRGRLLGRITNIIRTVTSEEISQVTAVEVFFLFKGTEPFRILIGEAATEVVVRPSSSRAKVEYQDLLTQWWDAYTEGSMARLERADYPPVIDAYATGMLARRLALEVPNGFVPQGGDEEDGIVPTLQLIGGSETLQGRYLRQVSLGLQEWSQGGLVDLPEEPRWRERNLPEDGGEVPGGVSELAQFVPADSLYLRFGAFSHFLWFQRLTERFGGDIAQMVALRGLDRGVSARTEEMLNLRSSAMAQLLGPTVIEELAIVGADLLLGDGPSIGVLFRPRNRFLLGTSLRSDRQTTVRKVPGATLETIDVGGNSVSYLSTPDGRVRSFLLETDGYFLVTSSRSLVEQFVGVLDGEPSLAEDPSFVSMRKRLPLEQDTAISAYFSEGFLRRLAGPKYQIELRRRMRSLVEIQMLRMAELASENEGDSITGIEALVSAGYLPGGFGIRPEGGQYTVDASGNRVDTARGTRGAWVPVADVSMPGVTAEEANWYERRAAFFNEQWSEMDPLVVQVTRFSRQQGIEESERFAGEPIETIKVHAEVAPFGTKKYGWIAEQLGAPTRQMIAMPVDDVAWVQGFVDGDLLGTALAPCHLFVGLKDDVLPSPRQLDGLLDKYFALKSLSGYLGAWPSPGFLDSLPLGLGQGREVSPGMSRLLIGLYRYTGDSFSLLSFSPEIIERSRTQLLPVEAEDDSQLRIAVKDLTGTKIEPWVELQLAQLAAKGSRSGTLFLESLVVQLGVAETVAMDEAARLLGGRLQCPLGGEYRLYEVGDARQLAWASTFWGEDGPGMPVETEEKLGQYRSPLLEWFRGGEGRLRQLADGLEAKVELDLATQ